MTPGLKPSQPSQGQLSSLDSDDVGTILEREETLQMLRQELPSSKATVGDGCVIALVVAASLACPWPLPLSTPCGFEYEI